MSPRRLGQRELAFQHRQHDLDLVVHGHLPGRLLRSAHPDTLRDRSTSAPATKSDALHARGDEHEIEPFTREEARRILDAAKGHRNAARWSVALVLGIRQGEALGLRRSIEQGVHVRVVQEILGHARVTTTERYTHVAAVQVQDADTRMAAALWGEG